MIKTLIVVMCILLVNCNLMIKEKEDPVIEERSYDFTDNLAPSQNPPITGNIPMFVSFGFDDNSFSGSPGSGGIGGFKWVLDFYNSKGAKVTFFYTTYYIEHWLTESPVHNKKLWNSAMNSGHEVGMHTHNHLDGGNFNISEWLFELEKCEEWLIKPFDSSENINVPDNTKGIGTSSLQLYGHRPPYLMYNNEMFQAVRQLKYTYDCSIEEGWEPGQDGTNFYWPYTLDNGSPGHAYDYETEWKDFELDNHPGIWELPVYVFIIPPDELCEQYGVPIGLRAKMSEVSYDITADGKLTGIDWTMWYELKLTKNEFVAILKYSFDLRRAGNKCPFLFLTHTDCYSDKWELVAGELNANYIERQQALEEFTNYILTFSDVRIVSYKEVIDWMKNPSRL